MEHSISITIDGLTIIGVEDTDEKTIARVLRRAAGYAKSIERHGLKTTLRVIARDKRMKAICFRPAECGSAFGSTVVE